MNEARELAKDERRRVQIVALLKAADLGISDINVHEEETTPEVAKLFASLGEALELPEMLDREKSYPVMDLVHTSETQKEGVAIPIAFESAGTTAWLGLCRHLLDALHDGALLTVDELGGSLHSILAKEAIEIVQDPIWNPGGAQLLFNSHDTNLLGNMLSPTVLMRDQIWLTEKDGFGATRLMPLTDFRPRKEENLQRGYLQGRFGGIPVPTSTQPLLFEEMDSERV